MSSARAETPPISHAARNQVTTVAARPTPTPTPIGRRRPRFAPSMPAVIAASTSTDSSPSRKTRRPLLNAAALPESDPAVRIGDTAVDRLEHEDEEQDSGQGEQHPAMSLA